MAMNPRDYGGLSGNAPHSVCVNTWSLVVEIVWEGLEGVTLLEEVNHCEAGFELLKVVAFLG